METLTIDNINVNAKIGTYCLICKESVELTAEEEMRLMYGHGYHFHKVCDECRKAILRLRGLTTEGELT